MTPEQFYRSTLREVAVVIRGAHFRQEQRAREALLTGRTTAVLMRYPRKRRLPSLSQMMKPQPRRHQRQTKNQQTAFLREWAHRGQKQGLAIRIGRLDQPFDGPPRSRDA